MIKNLMNVLIVDDNKNDLELVKYHLSKAFPSTAFLEAYNKSSFYERLSWLTPDLIISDYEMRDCTGLELLIDVKSKHDIPFIFMSGTLDDQNNLSKSILNGASGYVLKENVASLPNIVKDVMLKEEKRLEKRAEKNKVLIKAKLKLAKVIEKIKAGEKDENQLETLEEAYSLINELE